MIKFQMVFYSLIFFFAFGRFLPIFYAPKFLHEFFSSWGFILSYLSVVPLLAFLIYLIGRNIFGEKLSGKQLPVCVGSMIIYVFLICMTPMLIELNHKIVIAVNKNRDVKNFVNPILGHRLEIGNGCKFGTTYTQHPEDGKATIFTSGVRRGTIIGDKPCESVEYAEFTSNEIGITYTEVKLLYLPAEIAQEGLNHYPQDKKKSYGDDWYYVRWSAAFKLF